MTDRTLVIVKPDGVQRGLVGPILGRLEARGLRLAALKFMWVPDSLARQHYAVHEGKPFYAGLIAYITSAPVAVGVFEGKDAVAVVRATVGDTDPAGARPGTIRGDWALEIGRNLVHASDTRENGEAEIRLWFRPDEIVSWRRTIEPWVSEAPAP